MPDPSRHWPNLPPLFLAGVLINWGGVLILAISTRMMIVSATLLTLGTVSMFVAAYRNRPREQNGRSTNHQPETREP